MLHGGFGSAQQAESAYGWDELADSAKFAVAYPDGVGREGVTDPALAVPVALGGGVGRILVPTGGQRTHADTFITTI